MASQQTDSTAPKLDTRIFELGLHPDDHWALASLPLIRAAWIGGPPNRSQIELVREFFDELPVSPEGYERCEAWFRHPLDETGWRVAVQVLREVAADDSHDDIGLAHLVALVSLSERVRAARYELHGQNVEFHTKAGDAELAAIADALGVDIGRTWAELLDELGEQPELGWSIAETSASGA